MAGDVIRFRLSGNGVLLLYGRWDGVEHEKQGFSLKRLCPRLAPLPGSAEEILNCIWNFTITSENRPRDDLTKS